MENTAFDQWAIVELFGHQVISGRVSEQVIAGQGFVRVDVPATDERSAFTRMFGANAIYAITPTTEEVATAFAARNVGKPVQVYQLTLPVPSTRDDDEF